MLFRICIELYNKNVNYVNLELKTKLKVIVNKSEQILQIVKIVDKFLKFI